MSEILYWFKLKSFLFRAKLLQFAGEVKDVYIKF